MAALNVRAVVADALSMYSASPADIERTLASRYAPGERASGRRRVWGGDRTADARSPPSPDAVFEDVIIKGEI